MGMDLLMARARLNHLAAAPAIPFVAACTPASVAANASISLALPAGAQAGDVLVAQLLHTAANNNPPTTSGPTGSLKVIAEKQFKWLDSTSIATLSVYLVPLAAADIANGSVTFGITPSDRIDATGAVFRGRSQTLLDSANAWGVAASTAFATSSASFSAPGFSTVTDGVMLVTGAAISAAAPPSQSLNTPAGFTLGMTASVDYNYLMQIAYAQQPTHGAAAAAAYTYSQGSGNPFGWCAWQLALKRAAPAITLSAAFPSSPHVGDTVSFDVTATETDGASGSLTITVDQLPAGLSIGATTMVDATHYKATVSGTLTTVQDVTSTFGATGGSVAATPLVHEFDVSEAPRLSIVQSVAANNSGTSLAVTLPAAPTDGNYLVAIVDYRTTSSRTPSLDGGTWTAWSTGVSARGNSAVNVFKRLVASGDSATTTITFGSSDVQSAVIMEVTGSTGTMSSAAIVNTGPYPQALTIPAGASDALPIAFNTWGSGSGTTYTPTAPSGWSAVNSIASGANLMGVFARSALSSGAAISVTPSGSISTSLYPQCGGFLIS